MAVDSRDKRFSAMGLALPFRVYPNPDGDVGSIDRVQWLPLYRATIMQTVAKLDVTGSVALTANVTGSEATRA